MLAGINPLMMGGPVAFSAWDPAHKSGSVTLSSANRVATWSAGGVSVYGAGGRSSGKLYFEVSMSFTLISSAIIGIGLASGSVSQPVGASSSNSLGTTGAASIAENGSSGGSGKSFSSGNIVQIAVDLTAKKIWFGVGNSWHSGNPASNTGGYTYSLAGAMFPAVSFGGSGDNATINTGGSAFANAIPSGFSAWG